MTSRSWPLGGCMALVLLATGCGNSDPLALEAPERSGAVLNSEPIQLYAAAGVPLLGTSYYLRYASHDRNGRAVVVGGTVTIPTAPWTGPGPRPIVGYAIGTHGVGDACAPSTLMNQGIDYEGAAVELLIAQGYAVAVSDYLGLKTDEARTYLNRRDQGYAVLDSIRAAQNLEAAGLPSDGPVLTFGYSQGGMGSAAALELQPGYAPELDLIGGYAGAIPSDLRAALEIVDGGLYAGLMGYVIRGMDAAYPGNALYAELNQAGRNFVAQTDQQCAPFLFASHTALQSATLFADGRSLREHLADDRWREAVADIFVGSQKPNAPALVVQSSNDDIIPFQSSRDAAARWCARGATVEFRAEITPTHIGEYVPGTVEAIAWLGQRINGQEPVNNCGEF